MYIKKFVTFSLILLLLNLNISYAENWVTITAENGKSADLDLDSIKMAVDTVEYDIKTEYDNYIYINTMSTELYKEGLPTAVAERTKYKDTISGSSIIEKEKIQKRDYRELKSGTLQSEIFDVLSKELSKRSFSQGKSTWNKYLKKQRKQIYKEWSPHKDYWNNTIRYITPFDTNTVVLEVNKDGTIKEKYNDNGVLRDLKMLDALPKDYTAETFQLNVNMNHYKYAGAKMYTEEPAVRQISPISSEVTIAKNQRPPVIGHIEFGLLWLNKKIYDINQWIPDPPDNGLLCLLGFPFVLTVWVGSIGGILMTGILCLLTGVGPDDLFRK